MRKPLATPRASAALGFGQAWQSRVGGSARSQSSNPEFARATVRATVLVSIRDSLILDRQIS